MKTKTEILEKFNYTEKIVGDKIFIYNRKNVLAATIENGKLTQNFTGRKNNCGSVAAEQLADIYNVSR